MTLMRQDSSLLVLLEQPGKQEIKPQFIELRAKGWSYVRITKKIKVSKPTLSN